MTGSQHRFPWYALPLPQGWHKVSELPIEHCRAKDKSAIFLLAVGKPRNPTHD